MSPVQEFFQEGGIFMWPIVAVSVIGLTFIFERAWFWFMLWLRRDRRLRRKILYGEAPPPGQRTQDPTAAVLLSLCSYPDDEDLALEQARMLVRDSRAHLKVLAISAGLGSALGLFGTVYGIADSFGGVGLGNPAQIMGGLQGALNTTILGLVVYIACFTFHALYAQLSHNLKQDLEEDLNQARRALTARQGRAA